MCHVRSTGNKYAHHAETRVSIFPKNPTSLQYSVAFAFFSFMRGLSFLTTCQYKLSNSSDEHHLWNVLSCILFCEDDPPVANCQKCFVNNGD
jgi:hypothetical protein